MKSEPGNVIRMKTVSIQITEEEYQMASKIAARFYRNCYQDGRPMDIRELAMFSLQDLIKKMEWVLASDQTPPPTVIPFPLELTRR